MKKYLTVVMVLITLLVGMLLGLNLQTTQAQERKNFAGVMPFATVGGYIGFFDQETGYVYIYDDQMKKAVFTYKLDALGQPGAEVE